MPRVTSSPGNLQFDDTLQTAGRLNRALRKAGADLIVLAAHAEGRIVIRSLSQTSP